MRCAATLVLLGSLCATCSSHPTAPKVVPMAGSYAVSSGNTSLTLTIAADSTWTLDGVLARIARCKGGISQPLDIAVRLAGRGSRDMESFAIAATGDSVSADSLEVTEFIGGDIDAQHHSADLWCTYSVHDFAPGACGVLSADSTALYSLDRK